MTSAVIFAGGEDHDFTSVGARIVAGSLITVDTTAGRFRSGYGRCALNVNFQSSAGAVSLLTPSLGNISSFWFTARIFATSGGGASNATGFVWQLVDSTGVVRLRMRNTSTSNTNAMANGPFAIETGNAAGTFVSLGNTSSGLTTGGGAPDKLDVFVNYAVAGQIIVYINGSQVFNVSQNITTNSQTTLDKLQLGMVGWNTGALFVNAWSEVIVSTRDTRSLGLVTQTATALGNTDSFTGGAVANVNTTTLSDTSPDYSVSAGQLQQYKMTPALPVGNFSIVSVVQTARATLGGSGPTKIDFSLRLSGSDYLSSDQSPGAAWGRISYAWDTNPATGNPWQTTELPNNSTAMNGGYQSVA